MAEKDIWTSESYQQAASFVPKLASKVVGWLDPQKDDVILDIGCGDGVLDVQMGHILKQGTGHLYGIDSSPQMIAAAEKAAAAAGLQKQCTFQVWDAADMGRCELLQKQKGRFTKVFSNAALHWILGGMTDDDGDGKQRRQRAQQLFSEVNDLLQPGGTLVLEMGGQGNVAELVTGIVGAVQRRIGLAKTMAANPWFFPDETWMRSVLTEKWSVEQAERVWRPTPATEAGGVDGWIRLMARPFLDAVEDETDRETCTREVVSLLEHTTRQPDGGHYFNYVRLRIMARKC